MFPVGKMILKSAPRSFLIIRLWWAVRMTLLFPFNHNLIEVILCAGASFLFDIHLKQCERTAAARCTGVAAVVLEYVTMAANTHSFKIKRGSGAEGLAGRSTTNLFTGHPEGVLAWDVEQ